MIRAAPTRNDYWVQLPIRGSLDVSIGPTALPAARAAPWSCHPRTTTTISCAPTRAARVHVCINRDALLWQLAALLGEPWTRRSSICSERCG